MPTYSLPFFQRQSPPKVKFGVISVNDHNFLVQKAVEDEKSHFYIANLKNALVSTSVYFTVFADNHEEMFNYKLLGSVFATHKYENYSTVEHESDRFLNNKILLQEPHFFEVIRHLGTTFFAQDGIVLE